VLTEWLVETARVAGYPSQATSIPGVAQRTGATTYYIEVFPVPLAQLGGRRPVFGLTPVPGALDAIVSSELLETTRQIGLGLATPERSLVISSSARTLTTQERMVPGDGRSDSEQLLGVVRAFSRQHHVFDMGAMASECATVVSAVMLGAIAGSGLFPFRREDYEAAVRSGGASAAAEASLRGFARAFDLVGAARSQTAMVERLLSDREQAPTVARDLPGAWADGFPAAVHDMLALGHARLLDYQGPAYAALYLQRLARVLAAERAADPVDERNFAVTREMARWLALWMAFDDIVRVADLKSRASRWQRVKDEVKAGDDDLLRVYDHFKPGTAEFAALLPPALAARLLGWERRRALQGKPAWALPLKVGAHTVSGMLALRLLANLRWLRVRGSRYDTEQAMIEHWLAGVVDGLRRHWSLGHELALCGRLIKGYGSTNERGKENLLHVLKHLAPMPDAALAVEAMAAAREAALADDAGLALDAALVQHGAAARPVKAQPVRWMRRPRQAR
jgi:indolepyruvate ferredoxin oxidoreductase beta subunit